MKKFISVLLAVCMVISVVPIQLLAVEIVSDSVFDDGELLIWNPTLANKAAVLGADRVDVVLTLPAITELDSTYYLYANYSGKGVGEGWHLISTCEISAGNQLVTFADVSTNVIYDNIYGNWGYQLAVVCDGATVNDLSHAYVSLVSETETYTIDLYYDSDNYVDFGSYSDLTVPGDTPDKYLVWDPNLVNKSLILGADSATITITLDQAIDVDCTQDLYSYLYGSGYGEGWQLESWVTTATAGSTEITFDVSLSMLYDTTYGNFNKYIALVCNDHMLTSVTGGTINLTSGESAQSIPLYLNGQVSFGWLPTVVVPSGDYLKWDPTLANKAQIICANTGYVSATLSSALEADTTYDLYAYRSETGVGEGWVHISSVTALAGTNQVVFSDYSAILLYDSVYGNWGKEIAIVSNGALADNICAASLNLVGDNGNLNQITLTSDSMVEAPEVPDDSDVNVKALTVTYNATYTESDWNSTPTIDADSIVGAEIGGRSTLVNILPSILEVVNAEDIVCVEIRVTASNLDTWQRREDHIGAGGAAGTDCVPGAGLYINSNWTTTENDWYLPDGCVFTVTEGFDSMTSLQIEVFGCDPYAEAPVSVYLDIAVSYIGSSIETVEPVTVVINGDTYEESIIFDTNYSSDITAYEWYCPASFETTPSVTQVVAALQNENVYVKVVHTGASPDVRLQSELGYGIAYSALSLLNETDTVSYYLGTDIINEYLAIEGATTDDIFWNIAVVSATDISICDFEIVTLTPIYVPTYEYITLDVPLTVDNWSQHAGLDSTIVTYNDDGSVTADGIGTFAFALPKDISLNETVTVNIKGTSDSDFRVWLMAPWQARMSDIFKASNNGFANGEFDFTFELTAADSDGSGNLTATSIQFKAASYASLIENMTLTSVTVTYGVEATPKEDDDTTLLVQMYAQDTDYLAWTELDAADGSRDSLSVGETIDVVFTGDAWNEVTTNDSFYVGLHIVDLAITAGDTSKIKYTISDITIKADGYDDHVVPVAGTYEKELIGYTSLRGAVAGNMSAHSIDLTEAIGDTSIVDYLHSVTEVSFSITFNEYDFDIEPTNAYTITFDANGGSGTMEDIVLLPNSWYGIPECTFIAPEGMIFDGWTATLADGSTYYGSVTSDVTLIANWKPLNAISEVEFAEFVLPEDGETLSKWLFTVPDNLGYAISGGTVYAQPKSGGAWNICSLDDIYSSDNYYRFVVDLNALDSSYGFDAEVSAVIAGLDDGTYMSYNFGSGLGISLHIRIEGVTYDTYSEQIDENIIFSVENFPVATNWWYNEWFNEDQLVKFSDILYNRNAEHIVVAFQGDLDEHLENYVFQIGLQLTKSDWTIHMFRGDLSSSDTIALHNRMEYIDGYTYVYLSVSDLITHLDRNNIDISNGTGYKFVVGAPSEYPVVGVYITCDESINESGTWGDNITWTVTSDGVLTISGKGDMTDIDGFIPYGHLSEYITKAVVEDGVTSIGEYAFYLEKLTEVTIAESVTTIEFGAFANASSLTSITIPAAVTSIGENVFDCCTSLESINVSEESTSYSDIDGVLFNKDATTLLYYPAGKTEATYTIPDTVTQIGWVAFAGSTSLETVEVPDSVTYIDTSAFITAHKLTNIYVSDNNAAYADVNGVLLSKNLTSLLSYPYGRTAYTYAIPETVTYISSYAFWNNESITNLVIPENVTYVDWAAFGGCASLQKLVFLSPDTEISSEYETIAETTVIHGYEGSTAQAYAEQFGREFVVLGNDSTVLYSYDFEDFTSGIWVQYDIPSVDSMNFISALMVPGAQLVITRSAPSGVSWAEDGFEKFALVDSWWSGSLVNADGTLSSFIMLGTGDDTSEMETESNGSTSIHVDCLSDDGITVTYDANKIYDLWVEGGFINGGKSVLMISNTSSEAYNIINISVVLPTENDDSIIASGTCGAEGDNLTWTLTEDGTLTISGEGEMHDYDLGSSPWYSYRNDILSVIIEDSVTSIGKCAFYGCTSLTSITIPDSVTSIGNSAFRNCSSLTSITIPNSVTSIGGSAFWGCSNLISISIGNGVTSIGNGAFGWCTSLTSINVSDENLYYTDIDGVLFNKSCTELVCYPEGKTDTSYTIPDSVTSIGDYAFEYCSSLTSVTIPDSVTNIGYGAFSGCSSLTSITIPDSVTSIGEWAFSGCSSLTSITIPNSVTSIGYSAFYNCSSLTSITIPDSVTSIGEYAFWYCTNLTSVAIPDSVTSIGDYAFYNCSSLTSITIPDGVTSIGESAFTACTSLTSVTIPDSVTIIGYSAFADCSSLTNITIPNGVISIGYSAFSNCSSLTNISIPDSVTSIGDNAFNNCSSLESIYFMSPDTVINDSYSTISHTATIYGYDGSTAQTYAEKYGRNFVSMGEAPEEEIPTGNLNGDDKLDNKDAIHLLYHVLFPDEYSVPEGCDYNNDGFIDRKDALRLLYHIIFGSEIYPLY